MAEGLNTFVKQKIMSKEIEPIDFVAIAQKVWKRKNILAETTGGGVDMASIVAYMSTF